MNALIDVTDIRIETERLILRPWREVDLPDFYEYASVPGVGEMAGWCHHRDLCESRKILQMFIDHKKTFALELKENGKVIGSIGLEELDPDPAGEGSCGREIGYVLSQAYWGRGLMPEAVDAVIDYCFRVLDYDFLTCGHFERNSRSRRVIEKCGFSFFGESRYATRYETVENSLNYILHNPRKRPVDLTKIRLETPRLIMRAWQEADLQALYEFSSMPEVGEMAGWSAMTSLDEAKALLNSFMTEPYVFALELKETGYVIGSLSVDWLEPDPEMENRQGILVGYDLSKDYWGRGLMPQAVSAVVAYCFGTLHADYLRCSISVKNCRSQRVAEKCGFRFWKEWAFPSQGRVDNHRIYILKNPNDSEFVR